MVLHRPFAPAELVRRNCQGLSRRRAHHPEPGAYSSSPRLSWWRNVVMKNVCAGKLVRVRPQSRNSAFFENVFVLRVSNGQSSLGSGADYKLKADQARYSSDERSRSVGIFARADFAFPFAKIKYGRSS